MSVFVGPFRDSLSAFGSSLLRIRGSPKPPWQGTGRPRPGPSPATPLRVPIIPVMEAIRDAWRGKPAGEGSESVHHLEPQVAGRLLQAFHAAVQAQSLGIEEQPRLRESLDRDFIERLRSILDSRETLTIRIHPDGFQVDHCLLPADTEAMALAAFLRDEGIRSIHIRKETTDETLDRLLVMLGSYLAVRGHWRHRPGLWQRLLNDEFPGISFGILRGIDPEELDMENALLGPGEGVYWSDPSGLPLAGFREFWAERQARVEMNRNLDFEFGKALSEDMARCPADSPLRNAELRALRPVIGSLVRQGKPREALALLESIELSPGFSERERAILDSLLHDFRKPSYLRSFLDNLPPHPDSGHAAFLMRLGPEIAPALLKESIRYRSAALHTLLETLVQLDPSPFFEVLGHDEDPEARERALDLLHSAKRSIPTGLLRDLARHPAPFLRTKALRILVEERPEQLDEEEALRFLEDPNEGVRLQALRRLLDSPPDPERFRRLLDWFRIRQRDFSLKERHDSLRALYLADRSKAIDLFRSWLFDPPAMVRRRSDRENRGCALRVLGEHSGGEGHELLERAAEHPDPGLRKKALEILSSDSGA